MEGMSAESDRKRTSGGPNKRIGETGQDTGGNLSTAFDRDRKAEYCEELSRTGLRADASMKVGVHRGTVSRHMKEDPQFRQDVEDAMEDFREGLQREAHRRAVEGTRKPIYFQGVRIRDVDKETGEESDASIREFDTPLLILLLKRHCPEFKEKIITENRNVNVDMGLADMEQMTPEQRMKLKELLDLEDEEDGGSK